MSKPRAVFVTGPESSATRLVCMISARTMFGPAVVSDWKGIGTVGAGISLEPPDVFIHDNEFVHHCSLPFSIPPRWPSVPEWMKKYNDSHDVRFVFPTRDNTIICLSKWKRWKKDRNTVEKENRQAADIITEAINTGRPYLFWPYETLMMMRQTYVDLLTEFLDGSGVGCPESKDTNPSYLRS